MRTTIYMIATMFVCVMSITACKGNKGQQIYNGSDSVMVNKDSTHLVLKHLNVDKRMVMPYVTCSEQTVDSLLAIADTVYSNTGNYKLEDLEMGTKDYNKYLKEDYNDTIPIIVALFDSYSRMTNFGKDEANASFVWHEVAKQQMKQFYDSTGSEWKEPDGYEKLFHVVDGIMNVYYGGNQSDMNGAAWRSVMPTDYRLIEAYKRLADLCNDKTITKLIHDDYMYTLTTYYEHREAIDEWYSDLPREQGVLFNWLLEIKLNNIKKLVNGFKKGKLGNNAVKKNLKEHLCIADNKRMRLTKELLDKTRDEFR